MRRHLHRMFWSLYGRWTWDQDAGSDQSELARRVVEIFMARRSGPGEAVLDAGCGTGDASLELARAGFRVTGIDSAPGMLMRARAKVPEVIPGKVGFREADLDRPLPFEAGRFDHILLASVLQAVADPAFTLCELRRVAKPRGTLLLTHYPRPELHAMPLRDEVQSRLGKYNRRSAGYRLLVTAKTFAERHGGTRYWSAGELCGMLEACDWEILAVDDGRPIIILSEQS